LVELFAADIRQIQPRANQLVRLLDEERQARVRRLGTSADALRSLAAGLLLYDAFGEHAREVKFAHGKRGKPHLPNRQPFNLTHSGDYAVLALSSESVGVDIERIRDIDWEKVSSRFFHPDEQAFLAKADDPRTTFFTIWTLKEAYLKAEGQGFSVSPSSFSVLPCGGETAVLAGNDSYHFRRVDAFPGYRLSVCAHEQQISGMIEMRSF
jgi:4'-phosphopantetheinyl transferase